MEEKGGLQEFGGGGPVAVTVIHTCSVGPGKSPRHLEQKSDCLSCIVVHASPLSLLLTIPDCSVIIST